jgi:hypothetical protein
MFAAAAIVLISACATQPSRPGPSSSGSGEKKGAAEEKPEWVTNPESRYPDDQYLSAVGIGDTANEAKAQAVSQLSQIFEVKVKSTFEGVEKYKEIIENDKKVQTSEEIAVTEEVRLESDQSLINVQYSDVYVGEDARNYAVAYIDRDKTADIYESRIDTFFDRVENFLSQAQSADRTSYRYVYLKNAILADQSATAFLNQLSIIKNERYSAIRYPYNRDRIYNRFDEVSEKMIFSVSVENDDNGKIASILKQLLSENNFKIADEGLYQAAGTIRFEEMPTDKNDYYVLKWYLSLDVIDDTGKVVITLDEQKRETAISEAAARSFSYAGIEEVVENKFILSFLEYLNNMVSMGRS